MTFYKTTGYKMAGFGKAKYKNNSTVYNGRVYHSKKEAGHAMLLDQLKRATDIDKRVKEWQPQYRIDIYLDKNKLTLKTTQNKLFSMIPDFLVTYMDGHQEIHEVKSSFTASLGDWRRNWKMLEAILEVEWPEVKLVLIN